ncbi:hypothetical protein FQN50_004647 [Emmonsiellopsis sp. PD_5]|nr:hypothetical protein FQN50_004647 [Emmonsiellopsis sp. PD_5]
MASTILQHPAIPYISVLLTIALQGITLTCIPPTSYKRACMLPVILLPVAVTYLTAQNASPAAPWNTFIAIEFGSVMAFEVFDNVCLSKKFYGPAAGAQKKKKDDDIRISSGSGWEGIYDKICFAVDSVINKRRINRVDQARNIPSFDPKKPLHVPSRRSFLLFRSIRAILLYLVLDLISSQPLEGGPAKFAPGKERIFARVLAKDISPAEIGEVYATIVAYAICGYSSLLMGYDVFSVIAVGLGISEVADWPPLFGSIWEIYSIRTFWRKFWHQLLLRPLENTASFITHSILRLPYLPPPHSAKTTPSQPTTPLLILLTAYTKLTLIFLISGIIHINSDRMLGIPFSESRSVSLFLRNACGIIIEDGVRWMYRSVTGSSGDGPVRMWQKIVGWVWMSGFALWAVPVWVFSILRLEVQPVALPVGVFSRG